jgi:hypothetical protein
MCKKKSESVAHIWITGGCEESIIFIKFIKCCYFHYLCGPIYPRGLPFPHKALENGIARRFALPFCSQTCKKDFKDISEKSILAGSKTPISAI